MDFEETRDLHKKLEELKPLFKPGGKFAFLSILIRSTTMRLLFWRAISERRSKRRWNIRDRSRSLSFVKREL